MNKLKKIPVGRSCYILGYARCSYYKSLQLTKKQRQVHSEVLRVVYKIREEMPKLGCKKLHYLLRKTLFESGNTSMGRDRLFTLLRERNMLIERKRKYAVTTNSIHPFKVYKNLILGVNITRPNQVWVSDITYVRTREGFSYVSLITDLFSRKIVGYHASQSLELEGCMIALKKALKNGKPEIHHSDRGSQYCSHIYTKMLKKHSAKISMAEAGNCYENAVAERINGILKQEFNLNATFNNLKHVRKALEQAVNTYNTKRPHWSIEMKVPDQIYRAA